MWGGITVTHRTPLHIAQGSVNGQYYRDNILTLFVVPLARRVGNVLFSGHQWPFLSCTNRQCSPPEAHLSNATASNDPQSTRLRHDRKTYEHESPPTTLAELGQALQEDWVI